MAISQQCVYEKVGKSLPVEKYNLSIQPTSGFTFFDGDQVEFLIPTSQNEFLNAVNTTIRFSITHNALSNQPVDNNFSNMIERVEVYHGSNLLEKLSGYGTLFTTMADAQYASGANGLTIGFGYDKNTIGSREGRQIGSGFTVYANMPFLSSIVGLASNPSKFLPLCKMKAGPIRVVITMRNGFYDETLAAPTFRDMTLNVEMVKVGQEAMDLIDQANAQVYGSKDTVQITTRQYEQFLYTIPVGTTAGTQLNNSIDARFSSVNGLIFSFLRNGTTYKRSSRINPYATFQVLIGGEYLPKKPIISITYSTTNFDMSESFITSQKYLGSLNDTQLWGQIKEEFYNKSGNATHFGTGAAQNAYYLMMNTEAYQKDGALFDGVNTLNDCIFVNGTILRNIDNTTIIAAVHIVYDSVLTCENGIMRRTV